jgi:uncharacterized protein
MLAKAVLATYPSWMSTPPPDTMPPPEAGPEPSSSEGMGRQPLVISAIVIELSLILVAMVWGWLFMDSWLGAFAKLRWDWNEAGLGAALSIPLFALFLLTQHWPCRPFRHVRHISDEILRPMLKPCKWPDVLLFSTLAGFCEELLFRGAIQTSLVAWLGPVPGILVAGVIFGLAHWLNTTYLIAATIIGLFLGAVFYWTDSLLVVMVTHGLYDVWAMLYLLYAPRRETPVPAPEQDSCTS